MKQLFLDVQAALKEIPELKWVDKNKGQMNFERPPILFPAALFTLTLPQANNINTKSQSGVAQITVTLCFDWGGNTNGETPQAALDSSLSYYDIIDKVYDKLQGWTNGHINPLERRNMGSLPRPDQYTTEFVTFNGSFIEVVGA